MTYAFTDDCQVEEFSHFDYVDEMNETFYDDDQALEEFSLECAFGPND
jgi:hypothetical protein